MWNAVLEEAAEEVPEVLQSYSLDSIDGSHGSKLSGKDIASLIVEEKDDDGEKQKLSDFSESIKAIIDHEKETQESKILDSKYDSNNDSTKDVCESTKCSLLDNMILDKTIIKDTIISSDEPSPSSSNGSIESFHISESSGSARDRSISELSVSVPIHEVSSSRAEKNISAVFEGLSHVESPKKNVPGIESLHNSHKADFSSDFIETEGDDSLKSFQSGSKKSISEMISLFEGSQGEEPVKETFGRQSPRKSGIMSPRIKESLDKIGPCLSRCSSVDFNSYTLGPQNSSNAIVSSSCTETDNYVPVNDKLLPKFDSTEFDHSQNVKRKPADKLIEGYTYFEGILTIESLDDDVEEVRTEPIDDKPFLDKKNNMPCDKGDENDVTLCKVCDKPRSDIDIEDDKYTPSTNKNAYLEVFRRCRCDKESYKSGEQDVGSLSCCIPHDRDKVIANINELGNACNTYISDLSSQDSELTSSSKDSKTTISESVSSPKDTELASSSQHTELSVSNESKSASSKGSVVCSLSFGVKSDEKVSDSESVLDVLSDVSESSEYVYGVMCKSPISVITEKTEESAQDKNSLDLSTHASDQEGNCIGFASPAEEDKPDCRHSTPKKFCQENEKFVQDSELKWSKLDAAQDEVDKNYNKSNSSQIPRFSQGAKVKKFEMSFCPRSPPFPGNIGLSPGPVRTNNLKRNNSKSMSNLTFSQEMTKGNKNWSLSTENLSSQVNSPRVYSLSPSHNAKKRGQYLSPRDSDNLRRRCLSAMALNDDNAKHYLQRKKAQSLSRLNQRSSSLNSITSFQRMDYSHIQSKVKQYIMEMKERDAKNSSRVVSTSSSPNKPSVHLSASNTFVIDEDLLKELSRLSRGDEENLPKELSSLHKKLIEASLDPSFVEELLRLLIHERHSRHETDKTLAALQLNYDNLLARHAEAENLIDRLRFYKDIKISKEYEVILKVNEEEDRKSVMSSKRTSPVPVNNGLFSSSEVERTAYVPKADSFNLIKTTSYPVADPFVSFVDDGTTLHVQEGIQCDKTNQELRSRRFEEKTESETWTRDAEQLEKKIKDFALLMGSNALCEEERRRIWSHILSVYWQVSSSFPSVMVQGTSNSPGMKLQELGQALQLMSARFHLSLQEKDLPSSPVRGQEEGRKPRVSPGQSHTKKLGDDTRQLSNISVGSIKKQVDGNLSTESHNGNETHAMGINITRKKTQEKDKFSAASGDELPSCGGSELKNTIRKQLGQRKKEADMKKDQVSLLHSPAHSQESMKTVGPLEKVKLWQATLTDPSLAPGGFDDSSESCTPSVLSLSSSHPFVPNCLEGGERQGGLCHTQTDRIEGVESDDGLYHFKGEKKDTTVKHVVSNSPAGRLKRGKSWEGEVKEDKELTWPSRRGSCVTPRGRIWGATKPRDMDSGCPGSDRSTRFSHNASLEQHDSSLKWPPLIDQYEGGSETPVHRDEINGNILVSNFDVTPKVVSSTSIDGKVVVNDAYNFSSAESNIPVSLDALRKAYEKNESMRTDANSSPFTRGSFHRASTVKTASTVKETELCKSSEGFVRNEDQDEEVNRSITGEGNRQLQSNFCDKRRVRELDKKYRSQVSQGKSNIGKGNHSSSYQTSGRSSSSSSSRTSKSPLDIHTNISRLKKDLEILKSQMLNLTGYMLKERQQQDCEDNQGSKTRRRTTRMPLKAVNPISLTDHSQDEEWEPQSQDLAYHSKRKERETVTDPFFCYIERDKQLTRSPRKQRSSKRLDDHHAQVFDKTPVGQLNISEDAQGVCRCVKSVLQGKQNNQEPKNMGLRKCVHHIGNDEKRTPKHRRFSRLDSVSNSSVPNLRRKSGSMDNIMMGGSESVAGEILSNIAQDTKLSGLYRVPSAPGGLSTLQPAVSSPIIYIEHYNFHGNCKNKENEVIRKHSSLPSTPSKIKFRKYGSQLDLMASLDEATLLAERLRLRSQAMLNVMRTAKLDSQASPMKRPKSARV